MTTHARLSRQPLAAVLITVVALVAALACAAVPARASAACGADDVARGRPALASSVENADYPASAAVDGDPATRWSSQFGDPQWLRVDFGATVTVCQVTLVWEAAYASAFQIQVSGDGNAWTTIYSTSNGAGGTQTLNVSGAGRYLRVYGTARGTPWGYSLWTLSVRAEGGAPDPKTPPESWWGDTSTIPVARNVLTVKVLNRTNGQYPDSQVFWSFGGQTRSIAEQPYIDMPANSAGRMYFHLGSPNGRYADFIEFTVGPSRFEGNTTRVDGFGLKLALRLRTHDGREAIVGDDYPTFQESRQATFQRFVNEVPAEFKQLGQVDAPYRIPAPHHTAAFRPGGAQAGYLSGYAAQHGVNATTEEIMGCSGPLRENPPLCAALNRHVAGLSPAEQRDPSRFYRSAPANYYAKFWHDHSIRGLAYGFPYDDHADQSSFVSLDNPRYLLVAVGW